MKRLLLLLLGVVVSSCMLMRTNIPRYAYTYECIRCSYTDTLLYSDVLYLPGDTVIEIPSMSKIRIVDVKLAIDYGAYKDL